MFVLRSLGSCQRIAWRRLGRKCTDRCGDAQSGSVLCVCCCLSGLKPLLSLGVFKDTGRCSVCMQGSRWLAPGLRDAAKVGAGFNSYDARKTAKRGGCLASYSKLRVILTAGIGVSRSVEELLASGRGRTIRSSAVLRGTSLGVVRAGGGGLPAVVWTSVIETWLQSDDPSKEVRFILPVRCMGSRARLADRVAGTAIKPELALHCLAAVKRVGQAVRCSVRGPRMPCQCRSREHRGSCGIRGKNLGCGRSNSAGRDGQGATLGSLVLDREP